LVLCATGLLIAQWTNFGLGTNEGAAAFYVRGFSTPTSWEGFDANGNCSHPLANRFPGYYHSNASLWSARKSSVKNLLPSWCLYLHILTGYRWLIGKGRNEEARQTLERIHVAEDQDVDVYFNEMREVVELEGVSEKSNFKLLFTSGPTQNLRRVLLACWMMSMQQLAGVNSVTVGSTLLSSAGLDTDVHSITFQLFCSRSSRPADTLRCGSEALPRSVFLHDSSLSRLMAL
jgi:hypothetical protein